MFYKPEKGAMWDPTVIWWKDAYYMLSMHLNDLESKWDGMWLAKSADGVHWNGVGRVLEDKDGVCKMFVCDTGDDLVVNFGSFSHLPETDNDTLKFYKSTDMVNWDYMYKNSPDSKWYTTAGRWDHMYSMHDVDSKKYYGYVVSTPKCDLLTAWGILESENGHDWEIKEPPVIEWGEIPPINSLETGGCEKIGDKYYYIGGFVGYARSYGYGLYTFVSDNPTGPFKPDKEAFRLCGFNRLPGRVFIQNLAAFCRGENGEILISNAVDAGGTFEISLLPMRKAVVDEFGHLRLGYWVKNDLVKGEEIKLDKSSYCLEYTDGSLENEPQKDWSAPILQVDNHSIMMKTDAPNGPMVVDRNMLVLLKDKINLEQGIVLEGKITASINPLYNEETHSTTCWRPSLVGFYLEEGDKQGIATTLEVGHPYKRCSYIETVSYGTNFTRSIIDTTSEGCATVKGIDQNKDYEFKLFVRRNVFELYVGGFLVQTFTNMAPATGRLGFIIQNLMCNIEDIKLYKMNL